ncbi:MAG: RsmD family RNA methyltransferase [Candidatus Omnitrophota bacterium]
MRIISGRFKGRLIQRPLNIRPTQDKVREALFDILGDIEYLSFIDLYAGSGAVGLEALSRGVKSVIFVEADGGCSGIIKKNIQCLNTQCSMLDTRNGQASIITMDALRAIFLFSRKRKKFDIVFLDPPYYRHTVPPKLVKSRIKPAWNEGLAKKTLKSVSRYDIVAPNGLVICQHFKKDILPEIAGDLSLIKQAKYGDTTLSFYNKDVS